MVGILLNPWILGKDAARFGLVQFKHPQANRRVGLPGFGVFEFHFLGVEVPLVEWDAHLRHFGFVKAQVQKGFAVGRPGKSPG